jgi:RimJ/RimL family protein N-acetyltransferase
LKIILETQRLLLREFELSDAQKMYELNLDKDVLQFTGDEPFESVEKARLFLQNYTAYQLYGMGRWAVIRKNDNEFLGWCGLKFMKEEDIYDVGYRFFKKCWGRGYATESASKSLEYGFQQLHLEEIIGRVMKENIASIRVLEKIGLKYSHDFDFQGKEGKIYKISKDDFLKK